MPDFEKSDLPPFLAISGITLIKIWRHLAHNGGLLRPWTWSNGNYIARVTHYAAPRFALCRQSDAVDRVHLRVGGGGDCVICGGGVCDRAGTKITVTFPRGKKELGLRSQLHLCTGKLIMEDQYFIPLQGL